MEPSIQTLKNGLIRSFYLSLNEDVSIGGMNAQKTFAVQRQLGRFHKKYSVGDPSLASSAIATFLEINEKAGSVNVDISDDIVANARLFISRALESFTLTYDDESRQNELDIGLLMSLWRYGPGASRGTKATHFADKIRETKLTVTKRSLRLFKLLRELDPHLACFDACTNGLIYKEVEGSTLSTVPKNEETDRTIGTEPLGNMALQLAAGMYIEGALRCVGVDISNQQDKNKDLAYRGSITGLLCTIDLKSASDLITPALIRKLWPVSWYFLMDTIRSPVTKLPDGRSVQLNMMSTMGNGFTFPMMTLTLLALIYGFYAARPGKGFFHIDYGKIGVFGDDIIIPSEDYEEFCTVLEKAGLIVNQDKSFRTGDFRESCGGDFYKGYDVTPFYVKSLSNDSEIYVAINQLLKWASYHRISVFSSYRFLVSRLLNQSPFFIPEWEDPSYGILSMECPRRYKRLVTVARKRELSLDHPLAMKIVTGGYVESRQGRAFYTPRPRNGSKPLYNVEKARLPKGYLDGHWPDFRPLEDSSWCARFLAWTTL